MKRRLLCFVRGGCGFAVPLEPVRAIIPVAPAERDWQVTGNVIHTALFEGSLVPVLDPLSITHLEPSRESTVAYAVCLKVGVEHLAIGADTMSGQYEIPDTQIRLRWKSPGEFASFRTRGRLYTIVEPSVIQNVYSQEMAH